jgi:hypothetical protein
MGTRADFWFDDGTRMEWLGSVAFDGYEWAEKPDCALMRADDEHSFRRAVTAALEGRRRDRVALPEEGWPWPWPNSNTTDYAYVLRDDIVEVYSFGRLVTGVDEDGIEQREATKDDRWPAMTLGQRQAEPAVTA